jgi:membrane protease YdiL (CAAX protease family)
MEAIMGNYEKIDVQQFSFIKIIILGLLPGLVVLFVGFIFASPFFGINFNVLAAGLLAIILGHIPTQLGILKYIALKENKRITDIIPFRNKTPILKLLISVAISSFMAAVVFEILPQYEQNMWGTIYDFIPDWLRTDKLDLMEIKYLKLTLVFYFIINGFFTPIVEEIYYRGFLLSRMQKFGKLAPLLNTIVFSIEHFFNPWEVITRIIAMTPIAYSVWINKNIKIGIIAHCLVNIFGDIGIIMLLLT